MYKINLQKYVYELSSIHSFYIYSKDAFEKDNLRQEIIEKEYKNMFNTALSFVKDGEEAAKLIKQCEKNIRDHVERNIGKGLEVLRRQLLEASYSIVEKFLCHVVRVYLYTFPKILKNTDKKVSFRTIVDLKENDSIFNHIVEKEINCFSRLSLQEKKKYLINNLKLTKQNELWKYEDKELWKDIDEKRQAIVHKEETPNISEEYLLSAVFYWHRLMIGIAIYAKIDQGINFEWENFSEFIPGKDNPTLR